MSERLHVRALLISRLDVVLIAISSGRYHFWVLHTAMQRFHQYSAECLRALRLLPQMSYNVLHHDMASERRVLAGLQGDFEIRGEVSKYRRLVDGDFENHN